MDAPVTLTPSPPTDFYEKDLLKILAELQLNPPTQETLTHAQSAVADAAADTNFREHILEEIRNLAGTVLQIEADFATISLSVSELDDSRAVQDKAGVLVKFLPEWTSHHEVYTSLLFSSQTTATQMKAKIDDLLLNILPIINDPLVSLDDKKAELGAYIEDLEEFQTKASGKAREFLRLREGISKFRTNLVSQVVQQQERVLGAIKVINHTINRLEQELASYTKLLSSCWNALHFDVLTISGAAACGSGAVLCLTRLAPFAGYALLIAGFAAIGFSITTGVQEQRKRMRDLLTTCKNRCDSLEVRSRDLQDINMKLRSLNSTFQSIFDQLGTMQQIWTLLKSDAVGLQEALYQTQNAKTDAGFGRRVHNVEKLWQTLAWALDNYALGIASIN